MKHYSLGTDEVELYKAFCQVQNERDAESAQAVGEIVGAEEFAALIEIAATVQEDDDAALPAVQEPQTSKKPSLVALFKKGDDSKKADKKAELAEIYNDEVVVTNHNLIIVDRTKRVLMPDHVETTIFPLCDIKIFKDVPQLKQRDKSVEIFFLHGERTLNFPSKNEALKFVNKAIYVMTGKGMFVRATEKVKEAIDLVDNTLGIDSMASAKGLAKAAIKIGIVKKKESEEHKKSNAVDDPMDELTKWKKMLDDGAITQEEYNDKKKKLLRA